MKKIAILLTTFSLLLIVWFLLHKEAEAERNPFFTEAVVHTSPTPPENKTEKAEVSPSPTPVCSPQPTPLSEEEKYDPTRELDGESVLNASLGTPDWDCDGVCNIKDNCIFVYNPDQKDSDSDGKANACDPKLVDPSFQDSRCDEDHDGIPDFRDNCLLACNPDQKDLNKNGIGDVCDRVFHGAGSTRRVCEKPRKIKVLKQQITDR